MRRRSTDAKHPDAVTLDPRRTLFSSLIRGTRDLAGTDHFVQLWT
jgi:hypothetical protein